MPKKPFYLTGQVEGKPFSVHQAGDRVILQQVGGEKSEIELVVAPTSEVLPSPICPQGIPQQIGPMPEETPPGVSAVDAYLHRSQKDDREGGEA
jgi:hypothetical protein